MEKMYILTNRITTIQNNVAVSLKNEIFNLVDIFLKQNYFEFYNKKPIDTFLSRIHQKLATTYSTIIDNPYAAIT